MFHVSDQLLTCLLIYIQYLLTYYYTDTWHPTHCQR